MRGSLTYFGSEDERNDLKARVDALLRTCPEESMRIQIRYEVNDQVGETLDQYEDARHTSLPAALALEEERVKDWKQRAKYGEFLTRSLTMYFIWNPEAHRRVMAAAGTPWSGAKNATQSFSPFKIPA